MNILRHNATAGAASVVAMHVDTKGKQRKRRIDTYTTKQETKEDRVNYCKQVVYLPAYNHDIPSLIDLDKQSALFVAIRD